MTSSISSSGFPVPLTSKAWTIAQKQIRPQFDADYNQQQFRNGLAVYAVEFYLQCMAFEIETNDGHQTQALRSQFLDCAQLDVKDFGTLECCPVQPGETTFQIPVEAWCDRLAYVIVQIDDHFKQAQILGFKPQPVSSDGTIPLLQLQPIADLPQYLEASQTTALSQVWAWANAQRQVLSNTVVGAFQGWRSAQEFYGAELSLATRSGGNQPSTSTVASLDNHAVVSKVVQLHDLDLALVMDLSTKEDGSLRVELMVEPEVEQALPHTVQLIIFDEAGQIFQQLFPTEGKLITRPFSAVLNEHFSIEVSYGNAKHIENFVI